MRRLLILLSLVTFAVATVCAAKTRTYKVTLMDGYTVYKTLTEPSANAGVTLPSLPNRSEWQFIGWTESQVWQTNTKPEIWEAGKTYSPKNDCSLWALYTQKDAEQPEYQQELESGTYLYIHSQTNKALYGVPSEGGTMQAASANRYDEMQQYYVEFASSSTAYITHAATHTPIGYKGTKMAAEATLWQVYHDGEETLFYTKVNNKTYVLWLEIFDSQENSTYAGLIQAEPSKSPMRLLKALAKDSIIYSNYPDDPLGIEAPRPDMPARTLRFGNYELRIENGKKHLRVIQ